MYGLRAVEGRGVGGMNGDGKKCSEGLSGWVYYLHGVRERKPIL